MGAEVCAIEPDGTIRIPLELLRLVGLEPGVEVSIAATLAAGGAVMITKSGRVRLDQNRLVLSKRDAIVSRLIGKIKIASQLATEIIETPELDVEAI